MKELVIKELLERYEVIDGAPSNRKRSLSFNIDPAHVDPRVLWAYYLTPVCFVLDISSLDKVFVEQDGNKFVITAERN